MKALLIIFLLISASAWGQNEIKFIVNSSNPITTLTEGQLQDFFLKRARQWPDGTPVRFFDRQSGSEERKEFLLRYIEKSSRQIDQHWIGQKLFSGDSSPTQVHSDALTVALVSRFMGGLGYVGKDFKGASGVKVISVKDE
jgi:ABC-type phosphate transport system substrate-binding protein